MIAIQKLIDRLKRKPKDFTYQELRRLLKHLGYDEDDKRAGSRVAFIHPQTGHIIRLHKPHPRPELKGYQVDYILDELKKVKLL